MWGLQVQAGGTRHVLVGGDFVPQGIFGNVWSHFCHKSQLGLGGEEVTTDISWVVLRGAAKHPIQEGII